ncbi:MAG: hypothetical protein COS14_13320 [Bacteroidetes bacterium CG02_land_8_20_14_3_00_31_25]|nr:ribosome assembly cofactor RimP [Bacteroidota bacterium]PIV57721.1 MAG: hypothetical protein COS14_13320 [Bacteroidetes bacterium CG02_land_8_20_14_3_00_31_25]PIX35743.1 MAG: hypothetical protein COZ59_04805 [Bacteroidetes bacterium CG_4_8_14_3_um_filter_31_14]PIY04443.1 MAG: hypothetical protein COZ21_06635 [Bacteroidetes bacterium CG_4_10_14_3_um_filter_31_20]
MIDKNKILKVAANADLGKEYVVVDVETKPINNFIVFIDSINGITIGDCVKVSRFIEKNINRDEEDYDLSVSSTGIDKPLTSKIQFIKNIGKTVEVLFNDKKSIIGKLNAYNKNSITLTYTAKEKTAETKKNVLVTKALEIELNKIKSVTIVISFK